MSFNQFEIKFKHYCAFFDVSMAFELIHIVFVGLLT